MSFQRVQDESPVPGFYYVVVSPGVPIWKGSDKREAVLALEQVIAGLGQVMGLEDKTEIHLLMAPPSDNKNFPGSSLVAMVGEPSKKGPILAVLYGMDEKSFLEVSGEDWIGHKPVLH